MRGNSVMTLATRGKTVLFLTAPDDALVRAFAVESRSYGLAFLSSSAVSEWWIGWVGDEKGQVQAVLGYLGGQSHWLGTDPQVAMRAASQIIREWDKLEVGHTEALAVQ